MPRRNGFDSIIAESVAKIASGIEDPEEFSSNILSNHVIESIKKVGMNLRTTRDGINICYFCQKGPFTKKGYYLHLMRSHYQSLIDLVEQESERIASISKDVEF